MDTASSTTKGISLRWRLWIMACAFPVLTIALPLALTYWLALPILREQIGAAIATMGPWVVWTLLILVGVSCLATLIAAGGYSLKILRMARMADPQSSDQSLRDTISTTV